MITVYVAYAGDAHTRFDRDYYVRSHLPLVRRSWARHGLERAAAFFPADDGAGTVTLCLCQFRDEAAVEAAFGSPEADAVMADVPRFTDVKPTQSRAVPL